MECSDQEVQIFSNSDRLRRREKKEIIRDLSSEIAPCREIVKSNTKTISKTGLRPLTSAFMPCCLL